MLYNQKDLNDAQEWVIEAIKGTEEVVSKPHFPCTFGVQGYVKELHYISALNYPYSSHELAQDITNYLRQIESLTSSEKGLSGLLVYFEPLKVMKEMNINSLRILAWDVLEGLKELDKHPCPAHISNDPQSMDYALCFHNELWFINFSSSKYEKRKSRNLNSPITLAMQPFSASDRFFKSDNIRKANAQKMVRKRAETFDGCPVHSGLGPIIGEEKPAPLKHSYFIGDTNEEDSFEPWHYKRILPESYTFDYSLFGKENEELIYDLFKNIKLLNIDINIYVKEEESINKEELSRTKAFKNLSYNVLTTLDEVKNNSQTVFVSPSYEDVLSLKENRIQTCLVRKEKNKEVKNQPFYFTIDSLYDVLVLYKVKQPIML